jgi:hypothetical protein
MKRCERCSTEYGEAKRFQTWLRTQDVHAAAPRGLAEQIRLHLESEEHAMFVIKINGRSAAITNTFDSAVSYVEGLRYAPRAVTITELYGTDFGAELSTIERDGDREIAHRA